MQNYENIPLLVKELDNRGILKRVNYEIQIVQPCLSDNYNEYFNLNNIQDLEKILWLWRKLIENGVKLPNKFPFLHVCEYPTNSSYTIDPTGSLYSCQIFVGLNEYVIGNVNGSSSEIKESKINFNVTLNKSCLKCKFLPICQGGCRLQAFLQKGDFNTMNCNKKYFERMIRFYLTNKYKQSIKNELYIKKSN